jgi:hypothetical protein
MRRLKTRTWRRTIICFIKTITLKFRIGGNIGLTGETAKSVVRVVTLGIIAIVKGLCTSLFWLKRIVFRRWVFHDAMPFIASVKTPTLVGFSRVSSMDTHSSSSNGWRVTWTASVSSTPTVSPTPPPTGLRHERAGCVRVDLVAAHEVDDAGSGMRNLLDFGRLRVCRQHTEGLGNTTHLEVFGSESDAQVFGIRFPTNHVEGASIGFDVDQNINKDLLVNVVMLRMYSKNHGHTV